MKDDEILFEIQHFKITCKLKKLKIKWINHFENNNAYLIFERVPYIEMDRQGLF